MSAAPAVVPVRSLLDFALQYARRGWPVHPLRPAQKTPISPNGCKDATTNEAQIRQWWKQWPDANIGLATGHSFWVLDVDSKHADAAEWLEGVALPDTLTAITGTNGKHLLFAMPDFEVRNSASHVGPHIDVRGIGGYIVAAPSVHPDTRQEYSWDGASDLPSENIAAAPQWLLDKLRPAVKSKPSPLPVEIKKGVQHDTLFRLASSLRAKGLSKEGIAAALIAESRRCEEIPPESHMWKLAADVCGRYEAGPSDQYQAQVERTVQWADSSRRQAFDDNIGLIPSLANALLASWHFAQAPGKQLFVYRDGVYKAGAEEIINTTVRDTLQDWNKLKSWTAELGKDVAEYIRISRTPWLWETPDPDLLVLKNGVLDLRTAEFRPHSHEILTPVQLPVDYDESATCPAWERFLEQTLPEDCHRIVYEIAAWLLTSDVSHQKAVLFVGPGGNGKSVLIDGLTALIGRENVANKTLHQLEDDKFATADLVGKLANVCADLPTQHLKSSSMFKAIVGGDSIDAQRKHKPAFTFRPYSRLLFSANAFPRSEDASDGFFRRWIILPFNRSFEGSAEKRSKRELDAELQSPAELSGLLLKALHVLRGFRKRGFSESETVREAFEEFRETTDPLTAWLSRRTQRSGDGAIECKQLLYAFNEEVSKPNCQSFMTSIQMTKLLAAKGIDRKRSRDWEYRGITWRGQDAE